MAKKKEDLKWNAKEYNQNSTVQLEAALELASNIEFKGTEQILDVGCGDGKITALISKSIPNGKIVGIDLSPEMITFAKDNFSESKYKNLSFIVQDANSANFNDEFNLIFSSFALHWIEDFHTFIQRIHSALKKDGIIAFTLALCISDPLEQATNELLQHSDWSHYFPGVTNSFQNSKIKMYQSAIQNSKFEMTLFEKVKHRKIFSSRELLENHIIQWYPFLNYLPQEHKGTFFKKVIDRYLEIQPLSSDGSALFEFNRLDVIAKKR